MSKLVTVFGGSGFLGRRIVEHLAAAGHDVRVGVRHPDRAAFLRRLDADGRIELVHADVWDEATVTRAVEGAASVINTVGHYVEKGGTTFDRIHGEGALHVARQTKQEGALRLIHISGLGADPGSDSPYVRARGIGESLVKEAFDGVTILRPGVIFGPGDSFLNRLAALARQSPVLPLFGTGGTRLQPVFVRDVAEGLREGPGRSLHSMPRLRTRRTAGLRVQRAGAIGARRDRQAYGHDPGPLPRGGTSSRP